MSKSTKIASMLAMLLLATACNKATKQESELIHEAVEVKSTELVPDHNFQVAVEAFIAKDYAKSAKAIETAADEMEGLAALSGPRQKENILNAVADLRDLATDVSTDHVDGIAELNYFFANSGRALAGLYAETTEASYYNLQGPSAGAELLKAIDQVESALRYHGRRADAEEKTLFAELRAYAGKLRVGEPSSKDELEKYLGRLSGYIAKRDAEIELQFAAVREKRMILKKKS